MGESEDDREREDKWVVWGVMWKEAPESRNHGGDVPDGGGGGGVEPEA
jgi:hypothetical protein